MQANYRHETPMNLSSHMGSLSVTLLSNYYFMKAWQNHINFNISKHSLSIIIEQPRIRDLIIFFLWALVKSEIVFVNIHEDFDSPYNILCIGGTY